MTMMEKSTTPRSEPTGSTLAWKQRNNNRVPRRVAAGWLACGLAAMGVAQAQAPAVTETVLHNFPLGQPKGANPNGGLAMDSDGNLYGTAFVGGEATVGVVFKV